MGSAGRHRVGQPLSRREGDGGRPVAGRPARDIWVKRLPVGPFSRITFGDTSSVRPPGRPTAATVLYITDRSGSGVGPATPTGRTAPVPRACFASTPAGRDFGQVVPSRDGRWLILRTAPVGAGNADILGLKTGDTTLVPLVASPAAEFYPALSPDGRWLAYASNESGTLEVYVRPFPGDLVGQVAGVHRGRQRAGVVQYRPGAVLHQRQDGDGLGRDPAGRHVLGRAAADPVLGGATRPRGPVPSFSVSPDDKRFLMVREGETAQQSELIVAENWLQQLKAQAR